MSYLSYGQIEKEFMRQVRLCSGLGKYRMLEIVLTGEYI